MGDTQEGSLVEEPRTEHSPHHQVSSLERGCQHSHQGLQGIKERLMYMQIPTMEMWYYNNMNWQPDNTGPVPSLVKI